MGGGARTDVRVWRAIVASLAAIGASAVSLATAFAAPVPGVNVPAAPPVQLPAPPSVPLPQVPAEVPAVPAPPPLPAPIPQAPATSPPPAGQSPAQAIGEAISGTVQQVADGSRAAVDVAAASPTAGARPRSKRARRAEAAARYRTRLRLVRRLRGCLDELRPVGGRLLVLRYGIGGSRPRTPARVARTLRLSEKGYTRVHRRAIRRLVSVSRNTGCRDSGIAPGLLVYAQVQSGMGVRDPAAATVASTAAGGSGQADEGEESGVLGESAEGGSGDPSPGLALPLADEPGDVPYLLAIGLLILCLSAWVLVKRRRAHADPYQSS